MFTVTTELHAAEQKEDKMFSIVHRWKEAAEWFVTESLALRKTEVELQVRGHLLNGKKKKTQQICIELFQSHQPIRVINSHTYMHRLFGNLRKSLRL